MSDIKRSHGNGRMSQMVVHGDTVYLAGQVGTPGASVAVQTADILKKIDDLLAEAGSDKTKILQAIIWLDEMADFGEMNSVWDKWVPQGNEPARAAGSAHLATPDYKVEIIVIAAK
jgi:enamine deaminase RidA (YjgF/YER057c/UK114 family)